MSIQDLLLSLMIAVLASIIANFITIRVVPGGVSKSNLRHNIDLGLFAVLVIFLSTTRWVLESSIHLVLIAILILFGILSACVSDWLRKKRIGKAIIIGIVLLSSTLMAADQMFPHYISLHFPKSVANTTDIRGQVSNVLSTLDWNVYVLVRPPGTSEFWVQPGTKPGDDGKWEVRCNFVGNKGSSFEVRALITKSLLKIGPIRLGDFPKDAKSSNCTKIKMI